MAPHTARRRGAAFGALLVASLLLAGCGPGGNEDAPAASTSAAPTSSPTAASETTTAEPDTTTTVPPTTSPSTTAVPRTTSATTSTLTVYFVHGDHLAAAHRTLVQTTMPATAAIKSLLAGPTEEERASGLTSAVPAGTKLRGITIADGHATVDLSKTYESGGGSLSMTLRLAQVVFTTTQFATVRDVAFRLDGRAVTVFGGEGLVVDRPVGRADYESVLPAIFVESPGWNDSVRSPLRIRGTANVFEAVFRVELTDWDGLIVASKVVMATSGTGTRGTFDISISYKASRSGNGEVIVSSESPKNGSRINVEEIPLTVWRS